jgi:hypothetical protein
MKWLERIIKALISLFKGRNMVIDTVVDEVVGTVEEKLKTDNELVNAIVGETGDFIRDLGDPAVKLGSDYVKAILFGAAAEIEDPVPDLPPDVLAELTMAQAAEHQEKLARRAAQIEKITRAEAENQAAAREVREAAKAFLSNLLSRVGSIGIKMLAGGLL